MKSADSIQLPAIPFNTNSFASDLEGEFSASVMLVQNSIIPAGQHIEGDIQPRPIMHRKTMILLKPTIGIAESDVIVMRLRNAEGLEVDSFVMQPPGELTKLAEAQADYEGSDEDFIDPGVYDLIITGQSQLDNMQDDVEGEYLKKVLVANNTVKIGTYNGSYLRDFYIPDGVEPDGKVLVFSSEAGYSSTLHYSGGVAILTTNMTIVLQNQNGIWYSLDDAHYNRIIYAMDLWSAVVPYDKVQPGIVLRFEHDGASGELKNIAMGAPSEVILHTIDIGMLTPYRDEFSFQQNAEYHRQYFHQLPVSRLIVSQYAPQYFQEVMMPDGTLLTDFDPSVGGVHEGNMRERIGKDLISWGIDNANYGINSSVAQGGHPYSAAQITAHNSIGMYSNGIVIHGLSGGAGIVTLWDSLGNEFSHELGHNYDLGHYPNGFSGSVHRPADMPGSCWGWDSDNNFFIPNFQKAVTNNSTCQDDVCQTPFKGRSFGRDAMASGEPFYPRNNAFTLHTPYALSAIQTFLESKAVFEKNSPTGFTKWNSLTKQMEPWQNLVAKDFINAHPDQVTLDGMTAMLELYSLINISFSDGYFNRNIYIPDADAGNIDKTINIQSTATYTFTIHVNGYSFISSSGYAQSYRSNGSRWIEEGIASVYAQKTPYMQGVAVATLVGYYDPLSELTSYLYPALHGSFGMVYRPDGHELDKCYVEVETISAEKLRYRLSSVRAQTGLMNKFHINVEEGLNPVSARIVVNGQVVSSISIDKPTFELNYTVNGVPL
ncbi:M66 family metalloprotease [Pseudomonas koreensis]|uniref:M66 family metalloprotease n=1 Tax=Pseudomonas koreensis TaxID=198620 RepID=UPI003208DB07